MLYGEIKEVCADIHTTHTGYSLSVHDSVRFSVIQTSQLMLYSVIIAVCSEIHTKHINTLCGQNVEFVSVKPVMVHRITTRL
jgi:hypothetical protein